MAKNSALYVAKKCVLLVAKNSVLYITIYKRDMIESAKAQFPDVFCSKYEPIELLALLQHHGIPTRLLDVTENAMVGLYFASLGDSHSDGEVILFRQDADNTRISCLVNAIADTYRFMNGEFIYLDSFCGSVKNQDYFLEKKYIIEKAHESMKDGADWIKYFTSPPIFTTSQIHSLRQQSQSGKYIIFANTIGYESGDVFFRQIDAIPKDHECIVGRAIVKGSEKENILKELAMMGISRRTLFPDNIDIVCEEIKKSFW